MKTKEIPAPTKLSQAIDLALEDQAVVEKNKDYEVDMDTWHETNENQDGAKSKCCVCFAGAVMAVTHQVPWEQDTGLLDYYHLVDTWYSVFRALDQIRKGNLEGALSYFKGGNFKCVAKQIIKDLGLPLDVWGCIEITPYEINKSGFKADMCNISKHLKKRGL